MAEQDMGTEVVIEKLTKWSNAPKVSDLKQDLNDAKKHHDNHVAKVKVWLDNLNVTGSAAIKKVKGRSSIVPKLIRKQAEWRYAALIDPFLSTEDIFNVNPQTWEDKEGAEQNQALLNVQFNCNINKVRFIDDYVRTGVDEGTIICKTGWVFEEESYEEDEGIFEFQENPEFQATLEEITQLQQTSPSQFETNVPQELKDALQISMENGVPFEPVQTGVKKVTKTRTVKNHPTVEVCDYRNVIIDPTCMGDIDKAGFVIYQFESSMSELEKDGRYKNLKSLDLTNASPLNEPDYSSEEDSKNFNYKDNPRKKIVVNEYWGYWDIDGKGIVKPIVATWIGNTMIRLEENPYPDKKVPFVVIPYLPIRRSIHGEPDGALLEDNQQILGATTRGIIDIMGKSANAQTGMRKDMLDVTNRRKFDNGQDYEFNPTTNPRDGIFMHTYAPIPQSAQFMLQMQNMEAESLTGVKSFSQGVSGQSLGNVAAGVRGALDAASKRELGILRRLASGIVAIGHKFISMNSEFLSDSEVVRITNEEFITIHKDKLQGSYDLKLSISTAEEDNSKAEELAFMLQTMGNSIDPGITKLILVDIANLRKMPKLAHEIKNYQPQPDPMAEEIKMLELELLKAKLANEQAQAQQRAASAILSEAKADTEGAKTANIASDTDQKNLDFVEQESGVHQARKLEASGAQAKAQGEMKMMDHELKKEGKGDDLLLEYIKKQALGDQL